MKDYDSGICRDSGRYITRRRWCDKCDELDKKIEHYRRILLSIGDQITVDRIKAMIGVLHVQKATLHPAKAVKAAAVGDLFQP